MHLNGNPTDEARELLAAFHHEQLETVDSDDRAERDRQWADVLRRVDELGARNRNGRIFIGNVQDALSECWKLPLLTPPPAEPAPIAESPPAAFPSLMLVADDGIYTVSVETPYGWVDVIHDQGPHVHHVVESHVIGEYVQRQAELGNAGTIEPDGDDDAAHSPA